MELRGDVGHAKSCIYPFGGSVSVRARLLHGLLQTYDMLRSFCVEIVLILMQDTCTVCVERTPGSKIILNAPNKTPR
jgi:hypothetical protein